ncbi:NAD-dependent epimerase/dehydratase family protein [Endozoicomonas sp. SM1973]|uniref:NAD-dependent epimerase/dehydratase family protein n=1 Tax=Spartinivicinus marinus TaxID=2994442 RepID=A0A853I604_9GAMM|nr:NAD-dependent epimerase/dehydratase family protein [Spartinivicinus marinus]MCX4028853.1 NAD-dependent epimerase/dehydratase family protein [Spartinivicinus marinus]NYZ65564.1 NAD-dependent epimerase/dehydratase family protein [Spartinivicinus marinus]
MNILITGASGFVGQAFCKFLSQKEEVKLIVGASRSKIEIKGCHKTVNLDGNNNRLTAQDQLVKDLQNIDVVVHLAGRAHVMKDTESDIETAYHEVNVEYTCKLAEAAAQSGVKRLVFLSSIKVNGESTIHPFVVDDMPSPEDAYGRSKLAAEKCLFKIAKSSTLEVAIVRPALVYGEGVKGNLLSLQKLIKKRVPLPFGAMRNKRNLCSLDALCDLIWLCTIHPDAANQIFLAADAKQISSVELVNALANGLGVQARLVKLPQSLLKLMGFCLGKRDQVARVLGNLEVDVEFTSRTLGWIPEQDTQAALARMVSSK